MGRQRRMEKKNKTLGRERSINIDTQYRNKIEKYICTNIPQKNPASIRE